MEGALGQLWLARIEVRAWIYWCRDLASHCPGSDRSCNCFSHSWLYSWRRTICGTDCIVSLTLLGWHLSYLIRYNPVRCYIHTGKKLFAAPAEPFDVCCLNYTVCVFRPKLTSLENTSVTMESQMTGIQRLCRIQFAPISCGVREQVRMLLSASVSQPLKFINERKFNNW